MHVKPHTANTSIKQAAFHTKTKEIKRNKNHRFIDSSSAPRILHSQEGKKKL